MQEPNFVVYVSVGIFMLGGLSASYSALAWLVSQIRWARIIRQADRAVRFKTTVKQALDIWLESAKEAVKIMTAVLITMGVLTAAAYAVGWLTLTTLRYLGI